MIWSHQGDSLKVLFFPFGFRLVEFVLYRWGSRRLRTFDRCLQLLVDWLSLEPASPQRAAAESWLVQALLRNDLSRILDPLLLKLLQPHSARVSIRHVTVQPESTELQKLASSSASEDPEDDIYAISSVDGQIIYHVTSGSRNNNCSKFR